MMKKNMTLAAFILFVLIFLFAISGKRAAFMPEDPAHSGNSATCSGCHARGKQSPLRTAHRQKEECLACHSLSKDCHPCPGGR